jgi:nuclear mRNA export protein PCID2/THP1
MILGRFPSRAFLSRPEAADVLDKFIPISNAIQKGNMIAFKQAVGPESGNEEWLFQHGVLLPLRSRCEVLVWRTFARRIFLLTYQFPSDPNSRRAPTLDLEDLVAAAQYCQKLLEGWVKPVDSMTAMQAGRMHPNSMFMKTPDLVPPPEGPKNLGAQDGMIFGNTMPDLMEMEAIVASLVQQDLLHGFISHNQGKFAILGAKQRGGPLNAGFPPVWETLKVRAEREANSGEIPGWVQTERTGMMGGVVNLTGIARPVGSGE